MSQHLKSQTQTQTKTQTKRYSIMIRNRSTNIRGADSLGAAIAILAIVAGVLAIIGACDIIARIAPYT